QAVIFKALAPNLNHRYPTATAFETDLHAFLEKRPTAAERENHQDWNSNATIEKSPDEAAALWRDVWAARARRAWLEMSSHIRGDLNGLLVTTAGALLGLLFFLPLAYLYRFYTVSDPLRAAKNYSELSPAIISADWSLYQGL